MRELDRRFLGRRVGLRERLRQPPNSWQKGPLRYIFIGRAHMHLSSLITILLLLAVSVGVFCFSQIGGLVVVGVAVIAAIVLDVKDKRAYYG